jgi:hypothetical protein
MREAALPTKECLGTLAQMSFEEFQAALAASAPPPAGLSRPLQALWHDARGDWEGAHRFAQDDSSRDGSWVHAYLHRKEGDTGNAGYWYVRARRPVPGAGVTLEAEWAAIARELLASRGG